MCCVGCDVSAHGGVHVVLVLTILKTRSDQWRHASDESEASVGESARSRCSVSLTDELGDPPHEAAQVGTSCMGIMQKQCTI